MPHINSAGTALTLTLAALAGTALAQTAQIPQSTTAKPHIRFIVMDRRFDVRQVQSRNTMLEACTALGKTSLVVNQTEPTAPVEQVVDCIYFKPRHNRQKPELMHMQFYQMLMPTAPSSEASIAALTIKAGFVPVQEIIDNSRTAVYGTFLLSDRPLQFSPRLQATLNAKAPDCTQNGCNTFATIPDMAAFLAAGGIDVQRAQAWQMVMPPQLYIQPPEQASGLRRRQPYQRRAINVSYGMSR